MATMIRGSNRHRRLSTIEVVRLGGEATPWDLIPPIFDLVSPDSIVQVGFAATEAGNMTRFEVRPGDPIGEGFVPLGRPVRPELFRLAPVEGVDNAFEIFTGNPQASGFLDDPELEAARFSTDADGVRWWRSGDLATVDAEGIFHHRGRIDSMVKVNGVLVEPGEIESALRVIDGIADGAVVVKESANGSKRLIGHLVVDDSALTPESVRRQLLQRLPQALVPAMFVVHQRFPVSDRGKLDRRALTNATWERWRSSEPRSGHLEQELWLASQVELILDLGEVGFDDDLWDLGLDSLGAVELCASIADAGFGELNPNQLLETRTVSSLVSFLSLRECAVASTSVALNSAGNRPPMFALPGGGGTALRFQALAQCLGVEQPVVVIEPRGMHCAGPVDRSIELMAAHAVSEINERLDEDQRCVLLGFSAGVTSAFETARQLHASGREVEMFLLDAVPGGRKLPGMFDGPALADERPKFGQRLRRRGPLATARRFPALIATRRRMRRLDRYYLDPGPPSHDLDRYLAFRRIQSEAITAYQPEPLPLACTLVRVTDNPIEGLVEPLFAALTVVEVGGDHDSMLMHPHVSAIATLVNAAVDATRIFEETGEKTGE
jgi:thioesterase domain-containing protein/acyl carrier protein